MAFRYYNKLKLEKGKQMKFVKTNDGNISAFVEGRSYQINSDTLNYDGLYSALQNDDLEAFNQSLMTNDKLNGFLSESLLLSYATTKQLPKNNVLSIGGGKSYLFSLLALPFVLP